MKILAIVADIYPEKLGGAEVHFVEVAKRITSKVESLLIPRVSYPHLPNLSGLFFILFATPVMIYNAVKYRPDLIWATLDFPQAQVGALVKLFTGRPLYITSQNPLLGEEELVGIGGQGVTFLVSLAFRQADVVAAVSSYSAAQAKRLGAKKVIVIPNGVDLDKFL
ncbi:glycosyltransferase [Candidatus Microgenomates bacterium]|nr:glycosyltransferase [Candidatus Microgenomates bacterium]